MINSELNKFQWTGYFPGVVGRITELHAIYFHENWGLDISFETQVGKEISEFMGEFQKDRDDLWVVMSDEALAGCIIIDGSQAETHGARLRWFIVASKYQGLGLGRMLLNHAIAFCRDSAYHKIYLWTFQGLDAARSLYASVGFQLCEEVELQQWGKELVAQKFELNLSETI